MEFFFNKKRKNIEQDFEKGKYVMVKKITKILVVDDEPQNAQIMREILSFYKNFEYRISMSGEQALEDIKQYYPDIILLDIMMPGLNGYEVCEKIREQEDHKFTKIIMVSGLSMIADRLKGYAVGADDYITKPFVEDELIAKLEVFSKLSRMEELDELKTTALNLISHETRTPLNGIILASDLLLDVEDLPTKAKQFAEMIKISGNMIKELVEKMSRFATLKDGIHLNKTVKNVKKAIGTIIDKFECDIEIQIDFVIDESEKLFLDWSLIEETIHYILSNAVVVTPYEGFILIKIYKNDQMIAVNITDQGPGIDPKIGEKLFDGLFSPNLMQHQRGTGVSLAISFAIIQEHGGTLSWENGPDRGAIFKIEVPCKTDM